MDTSYNDSQGPNAGVMENPNEKTPLLSVQVAGDEDLEKSEP